MHSIPEISIIILNYNTFQLTTKCIETVVEFTRDVSYEVILVDNNSTECDADLFKVKFPQITLIKNPHNSGFAKGNNLGIEASAGDFILLLNSDTYLIENSIYKSLCYYKKNIGCGVLGCRMIFQDGKIQHTARRFRSISWEIMDLFRFLLLLMPYKKRAQLMLGKYFKADFNTGCDWINGAFFFFKKEILDKLTNGKLDDRFFMYAEDHLWCWQFAEKGYKTFFYSDTTIVHINNGSTDLTKRINLLRTMFKHELEIMKERKGTGLYYFFFRLVYGLKEQTRILIKSILFCFTRKLMR